MALNYGFNTYMRTLNAFFKTIIETNIIINV